MTKSLAPMPPVTDHHSRRVRTPLPKWLARSLAMLVIYICVVFTALQLFVWQPHQRHQQQNAQASVYLKAHAVILTPWTRWSGPSAGDFAIGTDDSLYAFSSVNGGIVYHVSPSAEVTQSRLVSSTSPPAFAFFALLSDKTIFTTRFTKERLDHRPVVRRGADGGVELSWGTAPINLCSLESDGTHLWGVKRVIDAPKQFSILRWNAGETAPTVMAQRDGSATVLAFANTGDVYILRAEPSGEGPGSNIDRLAADGTYQENWARPSSAYPTGTPDLLRSRYSGPSTSPFRHIAAAPDGSVYASDGQVLWHFNAQGRDVGSWWLSSPTGGSAGIGGLAVSSTGTLYALIGGGSGIAKLTFPSS